MSKSICYIRVSTEDQDYDRQLNILKERGYINGVNCEYREEKFTGKTNKRPVLDKILNELTSGDTLICESLTRLSRAGVIRTLDLISDLVINKSINVVILKENFNLRGGASIDANTNLLLGIFSVLSQFERDLISERTKEGLKARKKNGVKLGRGRNKYSTKENYIKTLELVIYNGLSIRKACQKSFYPWCTFQVDLRRLRERYNDNNIKVVLTKFKEEVENGIDPFEENLKRSDK